MILTVLQLELKKWLPRPLLWGLWTICFFIISLFFYRLCVDYLTHAQRAIMENMPAPSVLFEIIKPLSSWTVIFISLLIPIFTTNAFSQEQRQHSLFLWANSTLRASEMVFGKFLCLMLFPFSIVFVECLMLSVLGWETHLDIGWLFSSVFCILFISASLTALGLFISSLTASPIAAMTLTYVAAFSWMLLEWLDPFPHAWGKLAQHLSLLSHSYRLLNGLLLSTDIIYYILFCLFWLMLTQISVHHRLRNL